jgi:prepilin signal peptidase PulO-like enzyme (type II secretory pathway)
MSLIALILLLLLGLLGGFAVNYLSDVLPWRRKLVQPFCLSCEALLRWDDHLMWWRKCPACGKRQSWRKGCVYLVYLLSALLLWRNPPPLLGAWLGMIVLIYFGVVVVIDMEHRLILHPVSLFGVGLGLVTGVWMRANYYNTHGATAGFQIIGISSRAWLEGLGASVLGGVVGFAIMGLLYSMGDRLMRALARRRGQPVEEVALGFGDVNLSGVLGLMLGWPVIILGLFISIFIGGIFSIIYLVLMLVARRYHLFTALPYGPYLVSGAILLLYFPSLVSRLVK